jgi:hypothetical protein
LINLAWRLIRYGMVFPLWGDEARVAVNLFDRLPGALLEPLDYLQIVPVLFLWAEWGVSRLLGLGELALRLLPVVAGVLSLLVFWRLARATLDRRSRVAAVALFAASYYPVRHATEVKPYSLDLLFGALLLLLGWRLLQGRGRLWTFGIVAAVSVWFSYPAIFVAAAVFVLYGARLLATPLVAGGNGQGIVPHSLWRIAGVGLLLAASFVAMVLVVGQTQAEAGSFLLEHSHWSRAFPPLEAPWRIPLWLVEVHTGNLFAYPNGGNHYGSAATFLLFLAGCVTLWRSRRRLLLAVLLSPFPLMLVAAFLGRYPYGGSARVAQHVVPSICLICGAGVVGTAAALLGRRRVAPALRIWVALMALFAVGGIVRTVTKPYKHAYDAETRRVVTELGVRSEPGDRWIVFGALDESALAPTLPRVPGWRGWGGDWATVHYYILRSAPETLLWAPDPRGLDADVPTLLLAYWDNHHAFPELQFARYVSALEARLGDAVWEKRYPLRPPSPMALGVRGYGRPSRDRRGP